MGGGRREGGCGFAFEVDELIYCLAKQVTGNIHHSNVLAESKMLKDCWFLLGLLFQKDCSRSIFGVRTEVFSPFLHLGTEDVASEEVMGGE